MKRNILGLLGMMIFTSVAVSAQPGGGFARLTPEQRTARIHQKLDSAFHLDAATFAKLDTALTVLYRAQDAKRQELFSNGMPNRDTMMAQMKKYSDAQDDILRAVLTPEQFGIWKVSIQPSMRPQRPPGGGNNRP